MNILAIGAHPDDIEITCAGTLAKYAKTGHKIFMATTTNGNVGSATLPPEEIRKIRLKEAEESAAVIGAEYICLDYDDEMLFEDRSTRLAIINLIRRCRANVILTHYSNDYNPDHSLTGKMVNDVIVMTTVPNIKTEYPPLENTPCIYYFDTANGVGFIPNEYVDITDTFEIKKAMFEKHVSQVQWMKDNYKNDQSTGFSSSIEIQARYRGLQVGVLYAEGFCLPRHSYRFTTKRILP
jgi:LmbE family N-acetylglucosaminyl deacetylase